MDPEFINVSILFMIDESDEEHTSSGSVMSQDHSDEDLSDSVDSSSELGR